MNFSGLSRTVEIPGVLPVVSAVIKYPEKGHELKQAEWFKTNAGKAAVKTGGELLQLGTTGHD